MNKGKEFELKAFEALRRVLQTNQLGLLPDSCKIFHRKHFSRDRDRDIEIDISIELHLPDAPNWSLLWAWECKDYQGHIPVDDVEEFWAKLTQIAGANVKGGLVISGALQEGALNFARTKGIAVVRLLPENQITHILWSRGPGPQLSPKEIAEQKLAEVVKAITDLEFIADHQEFFGLYDDESAFEWDSLVENVLGEADEIREIGGLFVQRIEDVFKRAETVIVCGPVLMGKIVAGERVTLLSKKAKYVATVAGIEIFARPFEDAKAGDNVCLLFSDLPQGIISRDFVVANDKAIPLLDFG